MLTPNLAGALILGLPLVIVARLLLWRRARPVFWFALALIVVALGYLMATGATNDIARRLIPDLVGPPPIRAK
ncbi:MAG: hypothetical protein AB7L90_12840 [Hyphomicrobiaceae bacterium]